MTDPLHPLFPAQPLSVWHRYRQQDLATLARKNALPVLPVYTLIERGPDTPPDAEEQQAAPVLRDALARLPDDMLFPVLPPLRHLPAQEPGQLFTLPASDAWRILEELIGSVARTGFTRLLILHPNPLLADGLDCGLRDARIATGLTLYRLAMPSQADTLAPLLREVYQDAPKGDAI